MDGFDRSGCHYAFATLVLDVYIDVCMLVAESIAHPGMAILSTTTLFDTYLLIGMVRTPSGGYMTHGIKNMDYVLIQWTGNH